MALGIGQFGGFQTREIPTFSEKGGILGRPFRSAQTERRLRLPTMIRFLCSRQGSTAPDSKTGAPVGGSSMWCYMGAHLALSTSSFWIPRKLRLEKVLISYHIKVLGKQGNENGNSWEKPTSCMTPEGELKTFLIFFITAMFKEALHILRLFTI